MRIHGLIPAHAGKTPRANTPRPASWAHPRSRGENATVRLIRTVTAGSSPLTRGKHGARQRTRRLSGLIPAHAGKTFAPTPKSIHGEAHPRSRGENYLAACLDCGVMGSSPLTRGKPYGPVPACIRGGLIPAHAGKTSSAALASMDAWAHPRSRGENMSARVAACCASGSSPLTRGKRPRDFCSANDVRLIPAHAGKTTAELTPLEIEEAHPRSRGENLPSRSMHRMRSGSSPLTRGKPHARYRFPRFPGLIPAHAGKTPS